MAGSSFSLQLLSGIAIPQSVAGPCPVTGRYLFLNTKCSPANCFISVCYVPLAQALRMRQLKSNTLCTPAVDTILFSLPLQFFHPASGVLWKPYRRQSQIQTVHHSLSKRIYYLFRQTSPALADRLPV